MLEDLCAEEDRYAHKPGIIFGIIKYSEVFEPALLGAGFCVAIVPGLLEDFGESVLTMNMHGRR